MKKKVIAVVMVALMLSSVSSYSVEPSDNKFHLMAFFSRLELRKKLTLLDAFFEKNFPIIGLIGVSLMLWNIYKNNGFKM